MDQHPSAVQKCASQGTVIEAYANAHRSITTRAYPSRTDSLGLQLFGEGSTVTSLSVWKMGGMAV
ncbi:GH32 C-terminal domain-containing protein [Streptomyces sp. NPDC055059]|uniref:GH32 C-terminal domain-containing protein n=1 Tax=Streptomyces sp. NPDC127172 TaxID=3345382 RepID=UPI003634DD50